MADVKALVSRLMTLEDRIIACMRCGNCQAVCPMFGATHMEADVARGKLALVDDLAHELIRDPEAVADKLGRCLLCGSCQANCPSGVKIMDIFMEAREIVYNYLGLSPIKKAIFRVVLAKPKLFNVGMRIGSPVSHILFKKDNTAQQTVNSPLLRPLIGDRHIRSLPNVPLHAKVGNLNEPRKFGGQVLCRHGRGLPQGVQTPQRGSLHVLRFRLLRHPRSVFRRRQGHGHVSAQEP